jgi:PAS domain S-box-containing protein
MNNSKNDVHDQANHEDQLTKLKIAEDELIKTRQQLGETEERYKLLFNSELDAILMFDLKTEQIVDVNQAWCRLYGFSKEEALTLKISVLSVEPEETKNVIKHVKKHGDKKVELRWHKKKDGTAFPIEVYLGIFKWQDRDIVYATVRDITERIIAQTDLQNSERKLRTILENFTSLISIVDEKGVIITELVNNLEITGYKPGERIGKYIYDMVHPDDVFIIKHVSKKLIENPELVQTVIFRYKRKDGIYRTFESVAKNLLHDPAINGILITTRDITERRKIEEELRKFYFAVDQNPATVVITDKNGFIEFINPKFTELTGYTLTEVIGKKPSILKTEENYPLYPALWQAITTGKKWIGEFKNRKKNGEFYWEFGSISPIVDSKGEITNYIKVAEDITDRKEAEERIKKTNQELKQQNEELDAFAHTVAHDLKSPLAPLVGYSNIIIDYFHKLSEADIKKYLKSISDNAQRMNRIIEEILLLASVRRTDIEIMPLNMKENIKEALQRLEYLITEYKADIRVHNDEWPLAFGYDPWIVEVLSNYISNAIKYGGTPPKVFIGADENKDYVRFWIKDNGIGIAKENLEKLYLPFEQLKQVNAKGHGLGLSIVKRIIEKLDGSIGVISEQNKGSTFYFYLPKHPRKDDQT